MYHYLLYADYDNEQVMSGVENSRHVVIYGVSNFLLKVIPFFMRVVMRPTPDGSEVYLVMRTKKGPPKYRKLYTLTIRPIALQDLPVLLDADPTLIPPGQLRQL